ncbi:MAG: hypothetical protein IOD12_08000 [Silvanigrellales bacterium]|nr:hypothetical protein [Silvanigrellales bacterium]
MNRLGVAFEQAPCATWTVERARRFDTTIANFERTIPALEETLSLLGTRLDVRVSVVPNSDLHYGKAPGHQIFGLRDDASPCEAALFLAHALLHEITEKTDTPRSKRTVNTPSDARAWLEGLLVLARNEGFANLPWQGELHCLARAGTKFVYFHDFALRGDRNAVVRAIGLIAHVASTRWDADSRRRNTAATLLKKESFPALNLLGFHIAETLERHAGLKVRLALQQEDVEALFDAYHRAGGALTNELQLLERACRASFGT